MREDETSKYTPSTINHEKHAFRSQTRMKASRACQPLRPTTCAPSTSPRAVNKIFLDCLLSLFAGTGNPRGNNARDKGGAVLAQVVTNNDTTFKEHSTLPVNCERENQRLSKKKTLLPQCTWRKEGKSWRNATNNERISHAAAAVLFHTL